MKRKISFAVILLMLSLLLFGLTACGEKESGSISFKTLTVNGNNVYGKVSNDTTYYSFIDEISTVGGAEYIVSRNTTGTDWLPAKSVDLVEGDNTVYIIEMINGNPATIYTVVIRRTPVYTVTFDANGGSSAKTQYVVENGLATVPEETTYAGYTFTGWDYDFSAPIMSDTNITAIWKANTDTKYTVEYYLENLDKSDYELVDTDELKGTTDTAAEALVKEFEHFTFNSAKSVTSGNINGDGTLVLKVYYTRNQYTLSNANTDYGSITNNGTYTYDYGKTVTTTATVKLLGCEFAGWYSDGKLISKDATYTFAVDKNLEARFAPVEALKDFYFTSTATTCEITGIKDKKATDIVIPDFVTSIGDVAFRDCTSLTSVTIGNGVTSIGDCAFQSCASITSVTIGNSVTSIGDYAFNGCFKLVEVINLSSLNITTGSNSYGYVGYYAIEVHKGASKIVNYNDYLFYTYSGINYLLGYVGSDTELVLPESYNGEAYKIYKYAFLSCTGLTRVTIPDSVTSIGDWAFLGCTSLTSIKVDVNNTAYKDIDGNLYSKGGKTLIQYAVGKTATNFTIPDSVTSIGNSAFRNCTSLTSVVIPDSVTSIGDCAFASCLSLTSVTIPDSVTSIGGLAFSGCTSLTSVTIPDSVTSIGDYAFQGCSSLTIYCEAASLPGGWNSRWNKSGRPVVWGYKAEE